VYVHGDAVRLAQVLSNLLTNAAKFTKPDGRIELQLRVAPDGTAEITVRDQGAGISAALLPHVFDLFLQGEQSIERGTGGLGLGLAIVKTLTKMHGGSVAAASGGPGRGSTFTVRLPAYAGEDPAAERPAQLAAPTVSGTGRVLVVDDNHDAAESLRMLLDHVGYEVRSVEDGQQALATLDGFAPDLAILDIGLPGMDGYELARRLKADPRVPGLRLVALTGYGREPDRAKALAAEFDEHLVKPVEPERLFAAVERLMERR
jgi:CheY-like chemotaxis protein